MSNPHKYNTPEWMMYRLMEWIGKNGGEDSTTLMVHEARETIKSLVAQQDADKVDAERLDWLEEQTRESQTGTSFDYGRFVEDGLVVEKGYRFMRCRFLGERKSTIREAIDADRAQQGGQS